MSSFPPQQIRERGTADLLSALIGFDDGSVNFLDRAGVPIGTKPIGTPALIGRVGGSEMECDQDYDPIGIMTLPFADRESLPI